ncbi:hypothetical protein [Carnobacterium maltaromaticum]|uniref:hypothetical protein n=1 Tax=Carnobacterium maltaromaticum TaxID=2751 RepID=UPI00191BBF58|nr:hypothetical protein [Carnobacterium maltaromaticum]CAD5902963.1 transposase [Carnobacterium maltaromaticum]
MTIPLFIDPDLEYLHSELINEKIVIHVKSKRTQFCCPQCKYPSDKAHMTYPKNFDDLPIQGKKVEMNIKNKNYFCVNIKCPSKTFSETFSCINSYAKKTVRLEENILALSMEMSSVSAANYLNKQNISLSKSSICRRLSMDIRNLKKYCSFTDEQIQKRVVNRYQEKSEISTSIKEQLVHKVKELKLRGLPIKQISNQLNISPRNVHRYLSPIFSPIRAKRSDALPYTSEFEKKFYKDILDRLYFVKLKIVGIQARIQVSSAWLDYLKIKLNSMV